MNRRDAMITGAAGLALSALGSHAIAAAEPKAYRVGLIGAGWYGKNDLFRLIQIAPVEVLSICDVDQHQASDAAAVVAQRQKSKKTPKTYSDYRKMLDENKFDIVLVGTPDHWHALCAIAAMEAGADVYLQKPISRDVLEGEALVAAARKNNKVVQVGTQRKLGTHLLEAKKNVIEAGLLGKLGQVDLCCYFHMRANGNPPESPVPDWFDYEMWSGPAPMRPYDMIPHVRWWRTFMEYGNGIMGDMCVHMLDLTRFMLGLGWPKRVSSNGGIFVERGGKSNITDTQTSLFEYDDLNVTWQHRTWGKAADPKYAWSAIFYGDKGTLKASTDSYDFIPEGSGKPIHKDAVLERDKFPEEATEKDMDFSGAPCTRANLQNFLDCIETRNRPISDIEVAHISTASCILANVSMQLGRAIVYDSAKRQVAGDAEATRLLKRPYRGNWKHPGEALA
ncbi:MAG TPA: Gfo/Idh/MocA family oxidoreductase [Pirellulales bacterium]|nr:Gfo/Idh/MocA family oxidoreductase [Pirellulales bacterium]